MEEVSLETFCSIYVSCSWTQLWTKMIWHVIYCNILIHLFIIVHTLEVFFSHFFFWLKENKSELILLPIYFWTLKPNSNRRPLEPPLKLSPRGVLDTGALILDVQKEREREEYEERWRRYHGGQVGSQWNWQLTIAVIKSIHNLYGVQVICWNLYSCEFFGDLQYYSIFIVNI